MKRPPLIILAAIAGVYIGLAIRINFYGTLEHLCRGVARSIGHDITDTVRDFCRP